VFLRILDQTYPPSIPVSQRGSGTPLRNSNFNRRIWRPAVRAAGLPDRLRIHDLRHTASAIMIPEGAPLEVVKTQLGHSSISVTSDFCGTSIGRRDDGMCPISIVCSPLRRIRRGPRQVERLLA
jgi:site-specific recombinase XerC